MVQETAAQRTHFSSYTTKSNSGSIYGVGGDVVFRINDLEMVDQTGIEPVTS